MFEPNLIKDKAKARKRGRGIFLEMVTVVFVSGLLSIFVGSLFWKESTDLKKLNDTIASQQKQVTDLTTRLNVEEPAAIKRKLGMIAAYTEDFNTLKRRPYFTPILKDLYQQKPNAEPVCSAVPAESRTILISAPMRLWARAVCRPTATSRSWRLTLLPRTT